MKPENLEDTISLMTSQDFKDRFRAEYYQLKIRIEKLQVMLRKGSEGKLQFEPKSLYNSNLLDAQLNSMLDYKEVLEKRAELEGIQL